MEINVRVLRDAMALLKPVIPKKSPLAVLSNVLLENGHLRGTDLDCAVDIEVTQPDGAALLPFKQVSELLDRIPGDLMLSLTQETKSIKLAWTGGKANFTAEGVPSDFPPVPVPDSKLTTTVDGDQLMSTLAEIAAYAATDDSRPVLHTVALFLENPVAVVAADGFRLAHKAVPISIEREGMVVALIPVNSVYVLEYLHKKAPRTPPREGTFAEILSARRQLAITMDKTLMQIKSSKLTFTTQLVQGTFPNYKPLIPTHFTASVTLMVPDLEQAVRTVRGAAKDTSGIVRLNWTAEAMTVSAGGEEGRTEVDIAVADATPGRIGLNVNYLLPYLNGKASMMTMKLNGETGGGPVSFIYGTAPTVIIMPMQVIWEDEATAEVSKPEDSVAAGDETDQDHEGVEESEDASQPEPIPEEEPTLSETESKIVKAARPKAKKPRKKKAAKT